MVTESCHMLSKMSYERLSWANLLITSKKTNFKRKINKRRSRTAILTVNGAHKGLIQHTTNHSCKETHY